MSGDDWERERDPARGERVAEEPLDVLRDLLRDPAPRDSNRGRGHASAWVVGLAVAAAAVAIAVPLVASTIFQAETRIPTGGGEAGSDEGSWGDVTAPDARAYLEQDLFGFDLPVPPGVDIAEVRARESLAVLAAGRDAQAPETGVMTSDLSLREGYVGAVTCLWADELEEAADAGDQVRLDSARAVFVDAPAWAAIQEPGTTWDGLTVKEALELTARAVTNGATSVWRFIPAWAAGGCGPDRLLDSYR